MLTDGGGPDTRIDSIDVARGAALLLVFLSHYLQEVGAQAATVASHPLFRALEILTNVAAPAFVMISGVTLAVSLRRTPAEQLRTRKLRIVDRACFMLLVGHVLLTLTDALLAPYPRPVRQVFITDTIALCLLAGILVVPRWRSWQVAFLGSVSFVAGWCMFLAWRPHALPLRVLGAILGGPSGDWPIAYGFPLLEWGGVFAAGIIMGYSVSREPGSRPGTVWGRRVLALASILVLVGIVVRLVFRAAPGGLLPADVADMLTLGARMPPGPVHLAVFGGMASALLAGAILLGEGPRRRALRPLALLGRASFVVFIVQSAVYRDVVARLPLRAAWTWPTVFVGSVALIWLIAMEWDNRGLNRFLTLGLTGKTSQFKSSSGAPSRTQ